MAKKLPWSVSSDRIKELTQLVREETTTPPTGKPTPVGTGNVRQISVEAIQENPFQARKTMSETALQDLAASLRTHGFLQPLVGKTNQAGDYTLIAGHRRLAAAKANGLKTVPMILRDVTDEELQVLGLIENLQREDLHPVEKARALFSLTTTFKTHTAAAEALGMNRPALTQWLRVRDLGDEVLNACSEIPDVTLRMLHRLVQLPENRRLTEVRRFQSSTPNPVTKKSSPATGEPKPRLTFEYRQVEKRFSIAVELKVKTRRGIPSKDDYREALKQALERLENEIW